MFNRCAFLGVLFVELGVFCPPAALLYSVFGVAIEKARGAEDDINTVAAGTLTGMLFKATGVCFKLSLYSTQDNKGLILRPLFCFSGQACN